MSWREEVSSKSEEEVYEWMIEFFQNLLQPNSYSRDNRQLYNNDIYIPNLVADYLKSLGAGSSGANLYDLPESKILHPLFLNAAWEMCLRNILRPSPRTVESGNTVVHGGFSFTAHGREWLLDPSTEFLLYSVAKLGRIFSEHQALYGEGFYERSHEALRCFSAKAYFGCAAMCGAAAESILLKLAIAKLGDEKKALQIYHGKQGRKELKDKILELGSKPAGIKNEVETGFTILAYWRDDAAHGSALKLDSTTANVAIQMLCLFSIACKKHWNALTQ